MSAITTLGHAFHRYQPPVPFGIRLPDRLLHLYIVGQTGTGKSTLLANLAMQDAVLGHGFCVNGGAIIDHGSGVIVVSRAA